MLLHVPSGDVVHLNGLYSMRQIQQRQQTLTYPPDYVGQIPGVVISAEITTQMWGYATYIQMQSLKDQ